MTSQPITVAFVEDDADVRRSLEKALAGLADIRCVATCANGERALAQLPALKPQVVFMDINLPGMNGVECVRQLVARLPGVLVVMLTVFDHTDAIFNSLESGACGYLHKPVRGKELVAAVREVVAGGSPMSAKIARLVVQAFAKRRPPSPTEAPTELTDREQAVLDLLLEGYLYKHIADQVGVSVHTVHFHIRHIYEKLHVHSRAETVAKFLKR